MKLAYGRHVDPSYGRHVAPTNASLRKLHIHKRYAYLGYLSYLNANYLGWSSNDTDVHFTNFVFADIVVQFTDKKPWYVDEHAGVRINME